MVADDVPETVALADAVLEPDDVTVDAAVTDSGAELYADSTKFSKTSTSSTVPRNTIHTILSSSNELYSGTAAYDNAQPSQVYNVVSSPDLSRIC